jgi:gluconolactonase
MSVIVHEALRLEVLAEGLGLPEGPVVARDGSLYAVDVDGGRVVRVAGGETTVVARPGGGPNGMALVAEHTAVIANNGGFLWTEHGGVRVPLDLTTYTNEPPGFAGGWIERVDLVTGEVTVLHTESGGRPLRGPNDLVVDETGGIWFTDTGKMRRGSVDRGGLHYIPPDGGPAREAVFPLLGANGVGLSPDGRRAYVAETYTGRLLAWDLAAPGVIGPPTRAADPVHGGTCVAATPYTFDSLAVEASGRIAIAAAAGGIVVITPDGTRTDVYPLPGDAASNIALAEGGRRAVITLSRSGRLAQTPWPPPSRPDPDEKRGSS